MKDRHIKEIVKEEYSHAALQAASGASSCCSTERSRRDHDPITSNHYSALETVDLPAEAVAASLGCGNPTALARLNPGETVLDLGSGGGIDVLLSAKRVGPTGKVYGLDMTDEMLDLARENQRKAGLTNVEFLNGDLEQIPLPDNSVDVIISNCVINLAADKDRVLAEAFRVLNPGGRFAVSDIVVRGPVPAEIRLSVELWIGCVAGALDESEYRNKLAQAGFQEIDLVPTRVYRMEDARELLAGSGLNLDAVAPQVDGKFISAFVRARKPDVEVDENCLRLLALHQPAARDLRFITTAMKISTELERMSDLAENIAERAIELNEEPQLKPYIDLPRMGNWTLRMVKESLDSFVNQDAVLARKVCTDDDFVDDLTEQLFRELMSFMIENPQTISRAIRLTFIGKYIERIADHATNVAELVVYLVEGKIIRHTVPPTSS